MEDEDEAIDIISDRVRVAVIMQHAPERIREYLRVASARGTLSYEQLREAVKSFLESKLGAETGFPVRFTLPVLPAVSATVTFARCELTTPEAHLFEVPADYEPGAFLYLPERMAESVAKAKK